MINIKAFISSMKLFWVRQLIVANRGLSQFILNFNQNKFTSCGIEYINILLKSLKNKFWIDVFKAWVDLHNILESGATADSPLFYNPLIHIGGKSFFNKQLFDNNIRYINDIIEEGSTFLSFDKFCDMYTNVKVNFLEYASIIHAVKTYIRKLGENQTLRKLANPLIRENIHKVMKCKKSKFFL